MESEQGEVGRALDLARRMAALAENINSWVDFAALSTPSAEGVIRVPFGDHVLELNHAFTGQDNAIKITNAFMPKGIDLHIHDHEEHEWLIVYSGHIVMYYPDGSTLDLPENSSAYYPPGTPHGSRAIEDTWLLGITKPGSAGYPDDPER